MGRRAWLFSCLLLAPLAASAHSFDAPLFVPDPGATAGDNFGFSMVAVGNDILVGAPVVGYPIAADGTPTPRNNPGAVYLIDGRDGTVKHVFDEPSFNDIGPLPTDNFGVSIAASGNVVAIGASGANGGVGVVFVFNLRSGKLLNAFTEPGGGCPGDDFGGISIQIAGNSIFAGASEWAAPDASCNPSEPFEGRFWRFNLRTDAVLTTYESPLVEQDQFFGWGILPIGPDLAVTASQFPLGPGLGGPGVGYLIDTMNATVDATIPDPDGVVGDGFGDAPPATAGPRLVIPAQTALVTDSAGDQVAAGAIHYFDSRGRYIQSVRDPLASAGDYFGNGLYSYSAAGVLVAAPGGGPGIGEAPTPPGNAYIYSADGKLMHTFEAPDPQPNDGFGNVAVQTANGVAVTSMLTSDGQGGLSIFPSTATAMTTSAAGPSGEHSSGVGHQEPMTGNARREPRDGSRTRRGTIR